jgi:NadR type nicotinamide-nucleotide adenylyltransferase
MIEDSTTTCALRIVVTGSECTGKTVLAEALAEHYRTVCVPEFSRRFVLSKGAPPVRDDVDAIAQGQMDVEDELAAEASEILLLDTDLMSTVIYSRHYYGDCPAWIEEELSARPAALYLLAHIDVPWQPDGMMRDRGDRREEMQRLFLDELERRELPFVEVRGSLDERLHTATREIDRIITRGRPKVSVGNGK